MRQSRDRVRVTVFVDIDVSYTVVKYNKKALEEHLKWFFELYPRAKMVGYAIEESTSGNTHLLVYLDRPIPETEELHVATALGGDVALYFNAMRRKKVLGYADKLRFTKGNKRELKIQKK